MKKKFFPLVFAVGITLALSIPAHATTIWNFPGAGGVLGTTHAFTATDAVTALTAAGLAFADGSALPLHQNASGLGIGGGGCPNLDINGCGAGEVLRLEFTGTAWDPVSLTFDRLNDNGNPQGDPWVIFGDDDGNLFDGATLLASGDSTGSVNRQLTVLLPGIAPFRFLHVMPKAGSVGSDFRVAQVVGDLLVVEVPEPATVLLGMGTFTLFAVTFVVVAVAPRQRIDN